MIEQKPDLRKEKLTADEEVSKLTALNSGASLREIFMRDGALEIGEIKTEEKNVSP